MFTIALLAQTRHFRFKHYLNDHFQLFIIVKIKMKLGKIS